MLSNALSRLRRLCNALPKSKLDEQFQSLSRLQRLLALLVTSVVVITVPPVLVDPAAVSPTAAALALLTIALVTDLLARYNRR